MLFRSLMKLLVDEYEAHAANLNHLSQTDAVVV